MMVAFASLVHFSLEHRSGNAGRVLEHQPASIYSSSNEDPYACDGSDHPERALPLSHPPVTGKSPQCEHSEHAEGDQTKRFVGLHHAVDRLPMCDVFFGL